MKTKKCTKCKIEKSLTEFHKNLIGKNTLKIIRIRVEKTGIEFIVSHA